MQHQECLCIRWGEQGSLIEVEGSDTANGTNTAGRRLTEVPTDTHAECREEINTFRSNVLILELLSPRAI